MWFVLFVHKLTEWHSSQVQKPPPQRHCTPTRAKEYIACLSHPPKPQTRDRWITSPQNEPLQWPLLCLQNPLVHFHPVHHFEVSDKWISRSYVELAITNKCRMEFLQNKAQKSHLRLKTLWRKQEICTSHLGGISRIGNSQSKENNVVSPSFHRKRNGWMKTALASWKLMNMTTIGGF